MKWFKHDSDANMDFKLQDVLLDYGLEGYGLYWYCLELIAGKVEEDNISFELEHDARIIARNTGCTVQKIEEMMKRFVDIGLFENSDGTVTCLKLKQRLDKSMTSNPYLRKLITNMKVDNEEYSGYLYFILAENESVKRIKIGRSKNPHARINDLQKRKDCIGLELSILHTVRSDDCVSLETEMHRKFKHLNIINEWFEYNVELLQYIKELRTDYDLNKNRVDKNRIDEIRLEKTENIKPEFNINITEFIGDGSSSLEIKKYSVETEFDVFWSYYPKKVGKEAARKSWEKMKPVLNQVLNALYWQKESDQWAKSNGQFIPNPATYLNQGRWQDEKPVEVTF